MGRAHTDKSARYNLLKKSQQQTVLIIKKKKKNRAGFSHVCVCGLGQTKFPQVIYAYIQSRRRSTAQNRCSDSNRLRAYLVQYRRKLGSNWHRWRNMAMMQSALITCLLYMIQTSCQPTAAHYFIMEKCVNVHKSHMKKCDE